MSKEAKTIPMRTIVTILKEETFMKMLNKKAIAGLVAGAFILAGAAIPFTVQAAAENNPGNFDKPAFHQRHFDPDKMAQNISDTFGVNKEEVLKYQQEGIKFRDLFRASFLAKASGQSLKEVMGAKTFDNTWKDVAKALGVTKEKMQATRNDIASTRLENKLSISKQTSLELMQQGYRPRDIAVANELAQNTGKPIGDVLSLRKINNTWYDVAQTLGVDDNTFKQDMQNLKAAFPHPINRPHPAPGMSMPNA
jgi:hypothetical protein